MKKPGVYISDEILRNPELSFWDRVILSTLIHWNENRQGEPFKQKTICARWNLEKGNCSRCFKNLIKKGYIKKAGAGVYEVLKVVKTTTNKSCQNDNPELSKRQLKVVKNTTPHHISNKLLKSIKKETPEKEILKGEEIETPLIEKEKEKAPPISATPPQDFPLWQQAAAALVGWYELNEGQQSYIYGTTHVKEWETLKKFIVECCAYYGSENEYKTKQIIKNPGRQSALVTRWIANDRKFNGGRNKNKGKNKIDSQFIDNLADELNNHNI